MCRSTLIRRNIGNFLNYSVLLLVLAVSASYGLVMVTNPHFYVDAIESHRADVFTQGDILPRDSSPTPIIAAYPSNSSMVSFSIRNQVYTLATIPLPGSSILSFGWNVTASSLPDGTGSIQFSPDNATWSNLVAFELMSGHAQGRQPIDSSWASPGPNYLRASYWFSGSNLRSQVLILGLFVSGTASLTAESSITFGMSMTQAYYLAGIPSPGPFVQSFDWNIRASNIPDGGGLIQFSHDNSTWANLVSFHLIAGETSGRQTIDSSWAASGGSYLRAFYSASGRQFLSNVVVLAVFENFAKTLVFITSPFTICTAFFIAIPFLRGRTVLGLRMPPRLKREYFVLMFIVALSTVYVYVTMANSLFEIDEIAYARLGYSLVQGHLATDSLFLSIYRTFGAVTNSIHTPLGYIDSVEPWLDHPPLVGILLIPVLSAGLSPRFLPIVFSSIATLLIFMISRDRRMVAWTSAIIWIGLFLTHPILSMLFLDSGVMFFNLLTATMINEYEKSRSRKWLYVGAVAAGASALSKIAFGFTSLLYLAVYVAYARLSSHKEPLRANMGPVLIAFGIASIWPIYAFATAGPLFMQILQVNTSRSILSGAQLNLPFTSLIAWGRSTIYSTGIDVSLVIGWIALTYSLLRKGLRLVQMSSLTYLAIILTLRYAWFPTMIPLFPFFAIGMGAVITDLVKITHRRIVDHLTLEIRKSSERLTRQ